MSAPSSPLGPLLERVEPTATRLDTKALARLVQACRDAGSDALVVLADGKLVTRELFGTEPGPIEAMSVTKSVVSLAIGLLVDAGAILSVDLPVYTWFPEWAEGRKRAVTLRHLLQHTSGLKALRNTSDIYPAPDFVELALRTELVSEPGEVFFYNNKAVNLLPAIVHRASGERIDAFLRGALFGPLGMEEVGWTLDRAGNPHGMAGLMLDPLDLARVGELMRNRGVFAGRRVVSEAWVDASVAPQSDSARCGYLWWTVDARPRFTVTDELLAFWRAKGVPAPALAELSELRGGTYGAKEYFRLRARAFGGERSARMQREFWARVEGRDGAIVWGPPVGFNGNGGLGQWLEVLPRRGLVAVRMRRAGAGPDPEPGRERERAMGDFPALVRALVPDAAEDAPVFAEGSEPLWLRATKLLERLRR